MEIENKIRLWPDNEWQWSDEIPFTWKSDDYMEISLEKLKTIEPRLYDEIINEEFQ